MKKLAYTNVKTQGHQWWRQFNSTAACCSQYCGHVSPAEGRSTRPSEDEAHSDSTAPGAAGDNSSSSDEGRTGGAGAGTPGREAEWPRGR